MESNPALALAPTVFDDWWVFFTRLAADRGRLRPGHAVALAAASLALGLLGVLLFDGALPGINVAVWLGAVLLATLFAARRFNVRINQTSLAFLGGSLTFSLLIALRASPVLAGLDLLAAGGLLILAVALPRSARGEAGLAAFVLATVVGAIALAAGALRLVASLPWSEWFDSRLTGRVVVAGRAVAVTLVLLVLFGGLFISADAVFEARARGLINLNLAGVVRHAFWFAACTWVAAGVLWAVLDLEVPAPPEFSLRDERRLQVLDTVVVLGSLLVLFAAFVLIQLRYLFGGHDLVQRSTGLTYAEYAHRGFFELVVASALLLPVVLAFHYFRRRDGRTRFVFRALALPLVALLFATVASALQRLHVYVDAFGLTELRLYAAALLFSVGGVFLSFVVAALRERTDTFAWGALVAVIATVVALNGLNPDALIARTNIGRTERSVDVATLTRLSADATPTLVARLGQLSTGDRCGLAQDLLATGANPREGLRSWNYGRDRAHQAVEDNRSRLDALCAG